MEERKKIEYDLQTQEISDGIVQALIVERKRQGFTQQKIADDTGMKTSNVTRFESCKYTPTLDVLTRYADALGKKLRIELVDKE
jgi:transcriptional regulator with XRE-family HTH domain